MLRFAEEILLLLLDENRGDLTPAPSWSLSCALAGAVLMDLALEDRIDTDIEHLILTDSTPLGDDSPRPGTRRDRSIRPNAPYSFLGGALRRTGRRHP